MQKKKNKFPNPQNTEGLILRELLISHTHIEVSLIHFVMGLFDTIKKKVEIL